VWHVWIRKEDELTAEHRRELVATTAEWLFLASGKRMLTVRGTKGGERGGGPSSYAITAAAYAQSTMVRRTGRALEGRGGGMRGGGRPRTRRAILLRTKGVLEDPQPCNHGTLARAISPRRQVHLLEESRMPPPALAGEQEKPPKCNWKAEVTFS